MPVKIPTYDQLMNPILRALRALGGSGSIEEIYDKVVAQENLNDQILAAIHNPDRSTGTEVAYRLAWARTYLKKCGFLENSARGIWALTSKGSSVEQVDSSDVVRTVRTVHRRIGEYSDVAESVVEEALVEEPWREKLYRVLTQKLSAGAFERLAQRLLRESGFTQVEVMGRTGDGGIDGRGIARVHGLLSFHVLFQCKRYRGSVGSSEIRDFRGAMVGRSDKGLFITTGTFTPAAVREATRDGAPTIDLIDGNDLADKLKDFGLGLRTETVEVVTVDDSWFETL